MSKTKKNNYNNRCSVCNFFFSAAENDKCLKCADLISAFQRFQEYEWRKIISTNSIDNTNNYQEWKIKTFLKRVKKKDKEARIRFWGLASKGYIIPTVKKIEKVKRTRNRKDFLTKIFKFQEIDKMVYKNRDLIEFDCKSCINATKIYNYYNTSFLNDFTVYPNYNIKCKKHAAVQSIRDCLSNPPYNDHLHSPTNGVYRTCSWEIEKSKFNGFNVLYVTTLSVLDFEGYVFMEGSKEYTIIMQAIQDHLF